MVIKVVLDNKELRVLEILYSLTKNMPEGVTANKLFDAVYEEGAFRDRTRFFKKVLPKLQKYGFIMRKVVGEESRKRTLNKPTCLGVILLAAKSLGELNKSWGGINETIEVLRKSAFLLKRYAPNFNISEVMNLFQSEDYCRMTTFAYEKLLTLVVVALAEAHLDEEVEKDVAPYLLMSVYRPYKDMIEKLPKCREYLRSEGLQISEKLSEASKFLPSDDLIESILREYNPNFREDFKKFMDLLMALKEGHFCRT